MPCSLSAAYDGSTACPPPAPGINEDKVWLANRADITWTGGTNKVYTNFTMSGATVLYRWKFHNKGLEFNDEFTENETTGAGSWAPTLTGRILAVSGAGAAAIEKLRGADVVAIFRAKGGKYIVIGSESGTRLKTNSTSTTADNLGETVGIGADEEPSKHYELLITDDATTLAALIAAE